MFQIKKKQKIKFCYNKTYIIKSDLKLKNKNNKILENILSKKKQNKKFKLTCFIDF
jgi:hypothetical protein